MKSHLAVFVSFLSFLVIACPAVDITLENVDDHSPFSEETGNDAFHGTYGNIVFTKEELSKYNGENVSTRQSLVQFKHFNHFTSIKCILICFIFLFG